MIKKWRDIENGDCLFKDTDMNDKGKGFFMKMINGITSLWQSIDDKKLKDGDDHSEFLCWNGRVLETHSSVFGAGVRSQNFLRWCEREGWPNVVIIRPPSSMSKTDVVEILRTISLYRGLPYNLERAIKSRLGKKYTPGIEEGLFCSESTLLFAGFKDWMGKWPREAREFMLDYGYFTIFEGETKDLVYGVGHER